MCHVEHNTCIAHGRNIKTRCIGLKLILQFEKDQHSIRLDRMQSSFKEHFQPVGEVSCEKAYMSPRHHQRSRHVTIGQEEKFHWVLQLNNRQSVNSFSSLLEKVNVLNSPNQPNQSQNQSVIDQGNLMTRKTCFVPFSRDRCENFSRRTLFFRSIRATVKITSPVTENHYKNGHVNYKNFIMTNEMRTTIVTPCTPSTMTRTITTRTICTSEHSSAPSVVFHVSRMMCHTTLAQGSSRSRVCHLIFTPCVCAALSDLFDLPFYFLRLLPLLCPDAPWPAHRPRQPGLKWKITCATPPRGATTPTTSPSPLQVVNPTTRSSTNSSTPRVPSPTLPRHRTWT